MFESRCVVCDKEFMVPMMNRRWVCCNGHDCGCNGETLPDTFCSTECYENYEPPEADGEAYCGGEAAAALAESQARIQRELK